MKIQETTLPGVLLLTPTIYRDNRGAFQETWSQHATEEAGLPTKWVQDNFSVSNKNVRRGIHYQVNKPQGKLVRVAYGAPSSTYDRHVAVELAGDHGKELWVPEGFGHAFLALTETVGFAYKVTDYRTPDAERTILWNGTELAIPWLVDEQRVLLSEKDGNGAPLSQGLRVRGCFGAFLKRRGGYTKTSSWLVTATVSFNHPPTNHRHANHVFRFLISIRRRTPGSQAHTVTSIAK